MEIHHDLMVLIIAYTCVGLFVMTAFATALDLFNRLKLATDIRKKLHFLLTLEVAGIALAAFGGFLNPNPIIEKVEDQKIQFEKQITNSTKRIFTLQEMSEIPGRQSVDKEMSEILGRQSLETRARIIGAAQARVARLDAVGLGFPWIDTSSAPDNIVAAAPYLQGAGISIAEITPKGSKIVFMNNKVVYKGEAANPTTSENLLTQINTNNVPASFTIKFPEPLATVRFVRPALHAKTKSGITHPAWSAHALDADGRELSSQSESLTRSFSDVPARTYTLVAPGLHGISALRFDSDPRLDGKPFAAFGAILIEQLTMIRQDAKSRELGKIR